LGPSIKRGWISIIYGNDMEKGKSRWWTILHQHYFSSKKMMQFSNLSGLRGKGSRRWGVFVSSQNQKEGTTGWGPAAAQQSHLIHYQGGKVKEGETGNHGEHLGGEELIRVYRYRVPPKWKNCGFGQHNQKLALIRKEKAALTLMLLSSGRRKKKEKKLFRRVMSGESIWGGE